MLTEIIKSINWIDVLIVGTICRIIYIGNKSGCIIELFKFLGILFAVFIGFHYYSQLAEILKDRFPILRNSAEIISLSVLCLIVILIFKLIREGVMLVVKMEPQPFFDQWGGSAIAIFRSAVVSSLILVFLQISPVVYLKKNATKSFFNPYLLSISPKIYEDFYSGFLSKFFSAEKLNTAILSLDHMDQKKSPEQ